MRMIKRAFNWIRSLITLRRILVTVVVGLLLWLLVLAGLVVAVRIAETSDPAQPADVIIVLGSGLRRDGRPGDALYRRSVWAADLYHSGLAEYVICTGGIGTVQIRSEASACREVLVSSGVPANAVLLEEQSKSTEENARYAKQIMDERGFDDAILVTDGFHMFRASWIFDSQGVEHDRSPVPRDWVRRRYYVRHFTRELLAIHWQALKDVLGLPITSL
jgi:uncharacterized SAM-binding protein YcdF (DUF218 family)